MCGVPFHLLTCQCRVGQPSLGSAVNRQTVRKTRAPLAFWSYNDFGMRRLISITAFALFLAVPVWAQHGGGGHGGGGGHAGGFGGGHGGGFSGGHAGGFSGHSSGGFSGSHSSPSVHAYGGPLSSAAPRSFSGRTSFSQRNFSRGPFLHERFRTYRYNRNWYWGGYGYPWWGWGYPWGYYDPWWWWGDESYNNNEYDQNVAAAAEMNRENLEEQRMLRQEEAEGDQDVYAPSYRAPRAAPSAEEHGVAVMPATVLVFRDQHKEEIENYAIVGQTLWNFAPQHTEKISLADLDIPATTKANADHGVTFRVPVPGEAQ